MIFDRFSLSIALRTVLLTLTSILLAYLAIIPGYHAATLLVLLILTWQCILLFSFLSKTNTELTRFLDAARYADFSQRFEIKNSGAGFSELGATFTDIIKRFKNIRAGQETELRHLKAIIEHVPVPVISIHTNGTITLWNNSARRLFGSHKITQLDDLIQFGEDFTNHLKSISPGERRLVTFDVDGMEQQLTISVTDITFTGNKEKLLSMQNIQSELDGAQLQAWQDLVRVLTHEIMNSITPVVSLSKTAVNLLDDVKEKSVEPSEITEELQDVYDAVKTVSRRSEGLMKFVSSYRRLTRLPPANKNLIKIKDLFSQVTTIATQHWDNKIALRTEVIPSELDINVDRDMIEQILINILQNAEQAVATIDNPTVTMTSYLNRRGHIVIDIADNGAGVDDAISKKIFVPFFTTKRHGSGVGLALARQVMIMHGGSVKLEKGELDGALFRLTF